MIRRFHARYSPLFWSDNTLTMVTMGDDVKAREGNRFKKRVPANLVDESLEGYVTVMLVPEAQADAFERNARIAQLVTRGDFAMYWSKQKPGYVIAHVDGATARERTPADAIDALLVLLAAEPVADVGDHLHVMGANA